MWRQLIRLSNDSGSSLQSQLRRALVTAILDGHIPHHRPLPSSRELARQLGVARNTVVHAYQHLMDEGYLIAEERRGYFVNTDLVNSRISRAPKPVDSNADRPDWQSRFLTRPSLQRNLEPSLRDWRGFEYAFTAGQTDPALFPINEWRECCRQSLAVQAITDWMPDSVDNDDPLLLEQIQNRLLPPRGLWVGTEQILVTMGAQNALYLLARLLVNTGDKVGFEDPGYPDARNILELRNCQMVPLAIDDEGLIVDNRINECNIVYCTPSHQSPTTATMSLARRQDLLQRAGRHDMLIIEDDYESELNFAGAPTPALKSLDGNDRVIYVGSLSKTLAPGLRLGYMVGPRELIDEARALRRLMLRHPPSNNQNAVAHFLALGHHDSLVHRLSSSYKQRWEAMDAALKEFLPESSMAPAFGGSAFWVKLPHGVAADEVARVASENGILVVSGDTYFLEPAADKAFLRLGFSSIPAEKIGPGIEKLSGLINNLAR
ncbi:2-aminoadipate aminotransferase [Chromatiales bacterium (ex Bugula neritina AB1)]|nr:2-aminoadipate aminotransferase [Chromatiales bacterium (ex Bugula neritina AB1)]